MLKLIGINQVVMIALILSNCDKSIAPDNLNLLTYNIKAVVDLDVATSFNPFNVKFGDTLLGTFTYLRNFHDNNDQDTNQGWYYDLPAPANISFTLNSFKYNSNANLIILIQNNDTQVVKKSDIFQLSSSDTTAANKFNVSNVQEILELQDTTGTVFTNDSLHS